MLLYGSWISIDNHHIFNFGNICIYKSLVLISERTAEMFSRENV